MPFDFPAQPETITLPKSLESLSFVLRHRELWPKGFEWNYGWCENCAMGLACRLFNHSPIFIMPTTDDMLILLSDMKNHEAAKKIFLRLSHTYPIAPEHVADAIDQYLAAA